MPDHDFLPLPSLHDWAVPSHGLRVETIDAHAGGHSLRLILKGVPPLKGRTMLERWEYARKHFDHLRRSLLGEPRGHAEMYGCLLTPPQHSGSHCGALFLHRGGFSPMCGHGVIALTTILLECGMMELKAPETRLRIDTPAGTVRAYGKVEHDRVERVFFENVPSRVMATGCRVRVPEIGEIVYDLAFGGAVFAFVEAAAVGISTAGESAARLAVVGTLLLQAIQQQVSGNPGQAEAEPVFGVVFTEAALQRRKASADARQVCVFADGCVDRSPGGMAICARMALLAAEGTMAEGQNYRVEGITGSIFQGRIVGTDPSPGAGGLICEIEGQAWITGRHSFLIAADDPFRSGFLL